MDLQWYAVLFVLGGGCGLFALVRSQEALSLRYVVSYFGNSGALAVVASGLLTYRFMTDTKEPTDALSAAENILVTIAAIGVGLGGVWLVEKVIAWAASWLMAAAETYVHKKQRNRDDG
jgi:hypothetical protein